MNKRMIVGWTLLAFLAVFVLTNLPSARVRILVATVEMPIAFVVIVSAALGAGAALTFQYMRGRRKEGEGE